jgi:signal peptidase I
MREVVESVVIAFVLAFLFRTFEAEAFVIPTGSMAPTLMGRHKDVVCPMCGHHFRVSASDEVDNATGHLTGNSVISGTCPMCRYTLDFRPSNSQGETYPSYKGDRILVAKFPYRFGEPERWDVAVFKYPGGAKTNFIKRIVGLPNETIAISHGDLFVKPADEQDFALFRDPSYRYRDVAIDLDRFQIARKPPDKIQAILRPVYDNDCSPQLIEMGWPARWSAVRASSAPGWQASEDGRSFATDGAAEGEVWITYRHLVPSFEDWQLFEDGSGHVDLKPQLITDFSAYNTDVTYGSQAFGHRSRDRYSTGDGYAAGDGYGADDFGQYDLAPSATMLGYHWVGDLAVECTIDVASPSGEAVFALVEAGRLFQCRIDVATGKAAFSIDGLENYRPTATTAVRGPGTYRIMFSNVDDQLLLWVDGRVVRFDAETAYPRLEDVQPQAADLQPVRIGSRGAALRATGLKIYRDVYYIAKRLGPGDPSREPITDFERPPYRYFNPQEMARVLSDPNAWGGFRSRRRVAFVLDADQFLVLGDNSPESKDSRLWESEHLPYHVSRELLMGKALFIYWPHSLDVVPGTSIPVRFFPNFWRMHFVR